MPNLGNDPPAVLVFHKTQIRVLLETSRVSLDEIAAATGLGRSENLRLQFVQTYGVSPSNYRKRFATPGMG